MPVVTTQMFIDDVSPSVPVSVSPLEMCHSRLFIFHLRRLIDPESNPSTGGDLLFSGPLSPYRPWVPHKGFNREQTAEA
jgi:hypothetical protein